MLWFSSGKEISNAKIICSEIDHRTKVELFYIANDASTVILSTIPAIKGIMKVHQLHSSQKGKVSARAISCYCQERFCECYSQKLHRMMTDDEKQEVVEIHRVEKIERVAQEGAEVTEVEVESSMVEGADLATVEVESNGIEGAEVTEVEVESSGVGEADLTTVETRTSAEQFKVRISKQSLHSTLFFCILKQNAFLVCLRCSLLLIVILKHISHYANLFCRRNMLRSSPMRYLWPPAQKWLQDNMFY